MTKEEAIKFLSNKKVFVKNKGKEVQDKLFELGYVWYTDTNYRDAAFIYISSNPYFKYRLGYAEFTKKSLDLFYSHEFTEISVEDILNIKIEESLPKTWEEYYEQVNRKLHDITIQKSCHQYEAHRQLLHLRDCYRNGWKPKDSELRWIITPIGSGFYIDSYYNVNRFLSFQSKEIAEEFLKNFKDLIIQAGDFILSSAFNLNNYVLIIIYQDINFQNHETEN